VTENPPRRLWTALLWLGVLVAIAAVVWLVLASRAHSSMTPASVLALAGALTSGVGVTGEEVERRRRSRRVRLGDRLGEPWGDHT